MKKSMINNTMRHSTVRAQFLQLALLVVCALGIAACSKDDTSEQTPEIESVEYVTPTQDATRITSSLAAYISPTVADEEFGGALRRRLTNPITTLNEETFEQVVTLVLHNSDIAHLANDEALLPTIYIELLLGRNVIIVEPTVEGFEAFCLAVTAAHEEIIEDEELREMFEELDAEFVAGARQLFEALHALSLDPERVKALFMLDTDNEGIFAEAVALRGCDFHIVDRIGQVEQRELTYENILNEEGDVEPADPSEIETEEPQDCALTPYAYGLFADMFTEWINEQQDYLAYYDAMRQRSANAINTRAESSRLSLEDISTVQRVNYTLSAPTPHTVSVPLPVTVRFDVCSIYMERDDCDYYCIYKEICSYNQLLDCGPDGKREWRKHKNFGYWTVNSVERDVFELHSYYGPFMRDLKSQSLCHPHTDAFLDSTETAVEIPNADKVQRVAGAAIEMYAPKNSIGSSDQTSGFSYGFDGGLYIAKEPSINLGFSVSYDSSTTQTISDLEIEASSIDGIAKWTYTGKNLPCPFYTFSGPYEHSLAPNIMRQECLVDQSWIWRIPNPSGSYRLYDETSVTTSLMYAKDGFFRAHARYVNQETTKRVSFLMMPPPRSEQTWVMNVTPYSEELNTMLSTTHNRFWNKDNHEFTLSDSSADSRITIRQFVTDFEQDLANKRISWQNRNFKGSYTFSYYNIDEQPQDVISFEFVVE